MIGFRWFYIFLQLILAEWSTHFISMCIAVFLRVTSVQTFLNSFRQQQSWNFAWTHPNLQENNLI